MDYDIDKMADDLLEVYDYLEEVEPVLAQLEASSGVVLCESAAFPAQQIGLVVESLNGSFLVSYNMQLFALLVMLDVECATPVKASLKRYLSNVEPGSKTAFVETSLFRTLLNQDSE